MPSEEPKNASLQTAAVNGRDKRQPRPSGNASLPPETSTQPTKFPPCDKKNRRIGLFSYEDRFVVPKNLRLAVISLLHQGHPALNEVAQNNRLDTKACNYCNPCEVSGKWNKPYLCNS